MVRAIGMTVLIPPRIAYSEADDNTGYTGLVGLTSSHISFHHWDCLSPGLLQYDIFSSKEFDCDIAIETIRTFWKCRVLSAVRIYRGECPRMTDLLVEDRGSLDGELMIPLEIEIGS